MTAPERYYGPERIAALTASSAAISIANDIYDGDFSRYVARNAEPTPTHFFDPSATADTSTGAGTLANPYYTIAQVEAAFTGAMAGKILGIKRGTICRTAGDFILTCYGSSANLAEICAYGDAAAMPILCGADVNTSWTQYSDPLVWYVTSASSQEVYYDGDRLQAYSSLANLQAADYGRFWDSGATRIYIKPPSGENPNLGQVEVTTGTHAFRVAYSDVAASGFIRIRDIRAEKGRNSCIVIDSAGTTTISSVSNISVMGCEVFGSGTDGQSLGADGILVYGVSDTIRATGIHVASNVGSYLLNNMVEIAFATSPLIEGNEASYVGGNLWAEFWASVSGGVVRYNKGSYASTANRLTTGYTNAAFFSTIWTAAGGTSPDHTKNVNNSIYGNFAYDLRLHGILIYGGTGHTVYNNTLLVARNRGISLFANVATAGTCDAVVNNNLVTVASSGNKIPVDMMQGTANNSQGVSITATVTGDNGLYYRDDGASPTWIVNNSNKSSLAAYKAASAPFDANCINAAPQLDSSYRPTYASPAVNAGASVAAWTQDADGLPLLGAIGIGCYQMPRWRTRIYPVDNR